MVVHSNFKIDESLFKFNKTIAFFVLLFILLSSLNVFAFEINVTADNLEYSGKQGDKFSAKGNVVIDWKDKKVCADHIEFLLAEKIVNAYSNVKIEESKNVIYADSVKYNYDKESGSMKKIFGYFNNVFIRAECVDGDDNKVNTYNLNDIKLSNCDLDDPHVYFLKAKKGKIILNKKVTIYNAVLYINKIPIFYIPVFTKSLDKKGFFSKLKVTPALFYCEKGSSLKTMFSYPLTKSLMCKIAFDSFGRTSDWSGSLAYKNKDTKGTLTYRDSSNSSNEAKDKMKLSYFQMINYIWTVRSTSTYSNSHKSNYKNFGHSYIAFTRQKRDSNLSVGFGLPQHVQSKDFFDRGKNSNTNINDIEKLAGNYKTIFSVRPKINFTYYPKSVVWGIVHKFSFIYDSVLRDEFYGYRFLYPYNDDESEYASGYSLCNESVINDTLSLDYTLTKSFNFLERFTLKPTFEIFVNFVNKLKHDHHNAFIGGCAGHLNLRFRVTDWMDWDLSCYSGKVENKKDIFNFVNDLNDVNRGHRSIFSLTNYIHVGKMTMIKNFFQYGEKQSPLVTEITWNPKSFIIAYVKQVQLLHPFKTDYIQFYSKIGKLSKSYLNFNAFYKGKDGSKEDSNKIVNILGFGLWASPKWRFDCNMMMATKCEFNSTHFVVNGFEFKIHRNLHCYSFGFLFRMTKNSSGSSKHDAFLQLSTNRKTGLFDKVERKKIGSYFKDFKGMPISWFY